MAETSRLPADSAQQMFVTVSAFEGGRITLPERFFVDPADQDAALTVPSMSFLITHPGPSAPYLIKNRNSSEKQMRILFDLGLRANKDAYMPEQQAHLDSRTPFKLGPSIASALSAGRLTHADIDAVIFSHVHYDHHGDPADFPDSSFVVGHGALDVLKHGLGGIASHQHFDPDLLPTSRTLELPPANTSPPWRPLGPFPDALDLFGDASAFLIDAPGHLPGHVNLLCRLGPARWVYLAGDAAHDVRLLTGEKRIGTWRTAAGQTICIHVDRAAAEESIKRIARLREDERASGVDVEVVIAHDAKWYDANTHRLFPNTL